MAGHVRKHRGKYQAVVIDGFGRGADRKFGTLYRRKGDADDELVMMQSELLTGAFVDRLAGKVSLVERMRQDIVRRTDWSYNMTVSAKQRRDARRTVLRHEVDRRCEALRLPGVRILARPSPSSVGTVFGHVRATLRSAIADGILGRDYTLKVQASD